MSINIINGLDRKTLLKLVKLSIKLNKPVTEVISFNDRPKRTHHDNIEKEIVEKHVSLPNSSKPFDMAFDDIYEYLANLTGKDINRKKLAFELSDLGIEKKLKRFGDEVKQMYKIEFK